MLRINYLHKVGLIIFLVMLINCTERDLKNPFDTSGATESPIILSIQPQNLSAQLSWLLKSQLNITGFKIYRSIGDSTQFLEYLSLPPEARTFTDTSLMQFQKYAYCITALGKGVESPKSNIVDIRVAPSSTYILTRFGYSIQLLAYDLKFKLRNFSFSYAPTDWAFPRLASSVFVCHSQIGAMSQLDLVSGESFIFQTDSVLNPVHLEYDDLRAELIMLDDNPDRMGFYSNGRFRKWIDLPDDEYLKFARSNSGNIGILGKENFLLYDALGNLIQTNVIEFGSDILYADNKFMVLIHFDGQNESAMYKIPEDGGQPELNEYDYGYRQIRSSTEAGCFWLIQRTSENSDIAVKLSGAGDRLLEISLEGEITDMMQNPLNHSLVFVQRYKDLLTLTDSLGNILVQNTDIYDPIKVRIQ